MVYPFAEIWQNRLGAESLKNYPKKGAFCPAEGAFFAVTTGPTK